MALSILGKFKTDEAHFFPLRKEWIGYIEEEKVLEKLDTIVSEKDGEIGIELTKRYGVHPSENKAIPEAFERREKADKVFLEQLKAVSQKTGLSIGEVESIVMSDNSLAERVEEIMVSAAEMTDSRPEEKINIAKVVQESISDSRKKRREFSKETADLIAPFLDELNSLFQERSDAFDNYNRELITLFLNSPRRVAKANPKKEPLTRSDIEGLHPAMLIRFYNDYVYPDINQWPAPPAVSEPEKELEPEEEETEKKE
jgi:hypothetical protein